MCEDAFGFGADSKRKNKNPFKAQSVERFWFVAQRQTRLPKDQFPRVEPHVQDFEATVNQPHNKGMFVAGGLSQKSINTRCLQAGQLPKAVRTNGESGVVRLKSRYGMAIWFVTVMVRCIQLLS